MRTFTHPTDSNDEPASHDSWGSPKPASYWVDRAFPPGYNVATRQVIREASLAPFHRAVAQRIARLRRLTANDPAKPASKDSLLGKVRRIEEHARDADARQLQILCKRLDELLEGTAEE